MSKDNVIEFRHVTKTYKLFKNDKRRLLGLLFKKIPPIIVNLLY